MEVLNYFCCASPFIIPLFLGIRVLSLHPESDFSRLAGWLSLKPIVATPIWLYLVDRTFSGDWSRPSPAYLVTALPGILLTLLIVAAHRSALTSNPGGARFLLVMDTIRWGNSLLMVSLSGSPLTPIFIFVGLTMPTFFAFGALALCNELSKGKGPISA
jgi:hypothetical protein